MTEFKLTIEAPDLTAALNNLAEALKMRSGAVVATDKETITKVKETPVAAPTAVPEALVNPTPAPATPTVNGEKNVTTPAPTAPAPTPAPVAAPAPVQPVTSERQYTLKEIADAGSALLDQGKMQDLMALLAEFGVQAITVLKPEQFPAFVQGLKKLGATFKD